MATSTVTSKGQITIPKAIRERFRLGEGDILEFVVDETGRILLQPHTGIAQIGGLLREFARPQPVTVEEMKAAVRARAARKAAVRKR